MSLETMKCDACGASLIVEKDSIYCPEYYNENLGKKMDDHDAYNNADGQYDSFLEKEEI